MRWPRGPFRRLADLEARVAMLEETAPAADGDEWKPPKHRDHSGEPLDALALWRDAVGDYAHGWSDDDDEWNPQGYL